MSLTRSPQGGDPGEPVQIAETVSGHALNWLVENRARFGDFPSGQPPPEPLQSAISELALFLWVMRRDRHGARAETALQLLEATLLSAYARPELRNFVETGPPLAAIGHIFMWLALQPGTVDGLMSRDRLVRILASRDVVACPRPPVRFAELRLALDALGMPHHLPTWSEFEAVSDLGDLLQSSHRPDLYTATHWIFYLTDFGNRRLENAAALSGMCAQCLMGRIARADWDLVAEFILAEGYLTGGSREAEADAGWRALAAAQAPDGRLGIDTCSAGQPAGSDFMRHYHKCLVVAWAGLARGRARPASGQA